MFGKNPVESIDRPTQINEIVETFSSEHLNQQLFMITGIRGSGKTVLNISTNEFNPYRKRLIQTGILNGDERGTVKFCLPLFKEFILNKC